MQTVQKRIVFSKGQIRADLTERSDLSIYDKSARVMTNLTSTVSGGVRSRRGTMYIDKLQSKSADNVLSLYDNYTISGIGTNRNVFNIDLGETISDDGDNYFYINGFKMNGDGLRIARYTAAGSYTISVPSERSFRLIAVGGGGGGAYYGGGGAGAWLDCKTKASGTLTIKVGKGLEGTGGKDDPKGQAEASRVTWGSYSINCPGGERPPGFRQGWDTNTPYWTHAPSYNLPEGYTIYGQSREMTGHQESWVSGTNYGRGGDGAHKDGTGQAGNAGYFEMRLTEVKYIWEYSADNETWQTIQSGTLSGGDSVNIRKKLTGAYRYLRLRIDEDSTFNINDSLKIGSLYITGYDATVKGTKLLPYIYNNEEKYLLVLVNGHIFIYRNDRKVAEVSAPKFTAAVMEDLKYSYMDDTIVFTHQNMPPQILKHISAAEWKLSELAIDNPPYMLFGAKMTEKKNIKLTPSAAEGSVKLKADSGVFTPEYVGQYIDGGGGRLKVTEYTSDTEVSGNTVIPFYTNEAFDSWEYISGYEPAWSAARGYPRTCLFAQQRLWFGGSKSKPGCVWASRVGDYYNFKNAGNYDNDAISIDLLTNDVVVNMAENRGVHIFTSGQEMTISEQNLTPDNIHVTTNTKNGSFASISPVVIDGAVVYAEKNGHSLLSYVYSDEQAAYVSSNMSLLNDLIVAPKAMSAEINSVRDKGNYLYVVLGDGTMVVNCLLIDQEINSAAKFVTRGKVIDVACLASDTYLLAERGNELYLEKIADIQTDCTTVINAQGRELTVDGVYNGGRAFVYSADFNEVHTVQGAELTLDLPRYGAVNVGIPFGYELMSNPININGRSFDIPKRIARATIVTMNTPVLRLNGQRLRDESVYKFHAVTPYQYDAYFDITGEFFPLDILSVTLEVNYGR